MIDVDDLIFPEHAQRHHHIFRGVALKQRQGMGEKRRTTNRLCRQGVNAGAWQITALLILHGEADRGHCHQQAVDACGVNAHQSGQFTTTDGPIAGDQVLQAADPIDQALVGL